MSFVDVFVGNYTIIDFDLYDLWLRGLSGLLMLTHCLHYQSKKSGIFFTSPTFYTFYEVYKYCTNPSIKMIDSKIYRKFPKYSDTQKICCNHSKI